MGKYEWVEGMGEISGFGTMGEGGQRYEEACSKMLLAGLLWLDEHPTADPQFKGFEGVFGVLLDDNDDAKALSKAVTAPVPDCSGAMHQAAIQHCLFVELGAESTEEQRAAARRAAKARRAR